MIFSVIGFMDLLGTIAFAISGALVGVKRDMDIFGINILAVITACGGGMTRDVVIGKEPPVMFVNPIYVLIAVITANIVFLYLYTNRRLPGSKKTLNALFFWCDTLGLAAFTVDGVFAGINIGMDRLFLCTFLGTVTGVGGGAIRDIFANQMPEIFQKNIYAMACVPGAILTVLVWRHFGSENTAALVGSVCVILVRCVAVHFNWNLPRVPRQEAQR